MPNALPIKNITIYTKKIPLLRNSILTFKSTLILQIFTTLIFYLKTFIINLISNLKKRQLLLIKLL